jgi:hypothetical protein
MAMMSVIQPVPAESAAARAGIPRARYQQLENVIGSAIGRSVMNPAMAKTMGAADTSGIATLPADVQQRMRENMAQMAAMNSDSAIYTGIPDAVRAPLKQRVAGRLGELWRKRGEALGKAMTGR